ncbi:unnamed protein product, partial [Discosporangium mesarthrocarpum]
ETTADDGDLLPTDGVQDPTHIQLPLVGQAYVVFLPASTNHAGPVS